MRCQKFFKIGAFLLIIFLILTVLGLSGQTIASTVSSTDSDGDGLTDEYENETSETDPFDPDSDDDGLTDKYEDDEGLNPNEKNKNIETPSKTYLEREEVEDDIINTALFTFCLSFAVFALLAGAFTAYFGAGKSRAIGAALIFIGLIVILVFIWFGVLQDYPDDSLLNIIHWEAAKVIEAFVTVLAALIGAVAAIALFLVAIMKS